MKPGDHPEFFRFPAPAGRSRESTIRLDRDGRFWHDGEPIDHDQMAAAFAAWIRRHPDDGRFILTNGYDWTYFTVDDVPFFIRSVSAVGAGLEIDLSDGTREPLDASTLEVGARDALYAQVKGGEFTARFMPQAQTSLMPYLEQSAEPGRFELVVGTGRYPIGARPDS